MRNFEPTIKYLQAGVADYVKRSNTHHQNALKHTRKHYENPQQLRQCMHEHDLSRYALQSAQDCAAMMTSAMQRKYSQQCLQNEKGAQENAKKAWAFICKMQKHQRTAEQLAALFGKSSAPPGVQKQPALVLVNDQQPNAPNCPSVRQISIQKESKNQ